MSLVPRGETREASSREGPPLLPDPSAPPARPRSFGAALVGTWPGRLFLGCVLLALGAIVARLAWGAGPVVDALGQWAIRGLVVVGVIGLWRLFGATRRRLLWRVRRRLTLSYVLIGVVPALLLVAFFLFAGLMTFFHVSAYLFKRGIDDIVEEAGTMADTAAIELRRAKTQEAVDAVLERKHENALGRYLGISLAVVPRATQGGSPLVSPVPRGVAGLWEHASPPDTVPAWVSVGGFGGMLVFPSGDARNGMTLVIRAVRFPDERNPTWAVVIDLPVDERVLAQLREATGIELRSVGVVAPGQTGLHRQAERSFQLGTTDATGATPASHPWSSFNSVSLFDFSDWETGRTGTLAMSVRVSVFDIYERISAAQSRIGGLSLGDLFMAALVAIAILFLIIEAIAFFMGFALARTITGSVHQLFEGTERVRRGDFTHRIEINTRDQLGDLAASFNQMTASIESLLRQAEEKRRLEEELRIAREIQMSLLPRGPLEMRGLSMTAVCIPAREVGGDYYDFVTLGDQRLGVLIADVSGKGTSAALYMAELKGLILALSTIYQSPKQLLIEVNRIISDNIDSRSFITMTYGVIDLEARTFTYARAGHTPLIYLPAADGHPRRSEVLIPSGLVLGLRIDGIAEKFEQLLEECTLTIANGDVLVLFTDGISEAMNPAMDLFGEGRLQQLVEDHGHLPADQLRERILREVESFAGTADQHDDMTMILLKIEDSAPTVDVH